MPLYLCITKLISEQFSSKAHPALFEGRGGGSEPKNEALLFQSRVDIHFKNAQKTLFQSTVDKHFQNAHKTDTKLRRLLLCAFISTIQMKVLK